MGVPESGVCAIHIESNGTEASIIQKICESVIEKMLAGFSGSCQISWRGMTPTTHTLHTENLIIANKSITNIESISEKVSSILKELLAKKHPQE